MILFILKHTTSNNSLCQFTHEIEVETIDEESDDEDAAESSPIKQCHLCHTVLNEEDNLVDHMETDHRDYFDGMMEATVEMSSRT